MDKKEIFYHLGELKNSILRSFLCFIVLFVISYLISQGLIDILTTPIKNKMTNNLIATSISDGFFLKLNIAFSFAIFTTLPCCFYEIYRFCSSGMKKNEKITTQIIIISSILLFITGSIIAYFYIIPSAIDFFISFFGHNIKLEPRIIDYTDLVLSIMIAFGVAFQTPILIFLLHIFKILQAQKIKKYRKHAIVAIFAISAILTPPDVSSQVFLALIMIFLMEIAIISCSVFDKINKAKQG